MSEVDLNGPLVDGLVAALLRASTMLVEAGEAIRLSYPGAEGTVADALVFEGDCARTAAVDAMTLQQAAARKTNKALPPIP